MSKISVPGARIFTQTEGSGEPVLLIAGMMSDVASWGPLTPLLQPHYQIIGFDNRGAGRTICQTARFSIDDMVSDAIAVLDNYDIEKAHIVGHSLGGLIGLRLAKSHPDRVRTLTSLAAGNVPSAESMNYFKEMLELYKSDMPVTDWYKLLLPTIFSANFFPSADLLEAGAQSAASYKYRQSPENLQSQVDMFQTITPVETGDINLPVLSITGQLDRAFPPDVVRRALGPLPDVHFETIENIAHSIHWEAPQKIADKLLKFLRAHPMR
ncbi:MAG TPA: alpha/beta hydrolase [Devosia sp.]|nr:alpha/beta hydrolase [Devosia sp.]